MLLSFTIGSICSSAISENIVHAQALKYNKAYKYAKTHYRSRNQYYEYYRGLWSFKDDCTSFVSQITHASGAKEKVKKIKAGTNVKSTKYWFFKRSPYKMGRYSWSWSVVQSYYSYWTKRKHNGHYTKTIKVSKQKKPTTKQKKAMVKNIAKHSKPGDIIQFKSKKDSWHHSAFVDKIVKRHGRYAVYYASHTTSYLKRSLYNGLNDNGANGVRIIHMNMK